MGYIRLFQLPSWILAKISLRCRKMVKDVLWSISGLVGIGSNPYVELDTAKAKI